VLLLRKSEDAIIRVAVTDEDIMKLSGDSTVHMRDLSLIHVSALEKRQRMDIIVRYGQLQTHWILTSHEFFCIIEALLIAAVVHSKVPGVATQLCVFCAQVTVSSVEKATS
jgi:hypothetical protein